LKHSTNMGLEERREDHPSGEKRGDPHFYKKKEKGHRAIESRIGGVNSLRVGWIRRAAIQKRKKKKEVIGCYVEKTGVRGAR